MESKNSSGDYGSGKGIKRRSFGPTEQGNVWENEKMRIGEPGEGWWKD